MTDDMKIIHDPVHGNIKVNGVFLDILDRHEMQRLRSVKQLDFGYLVFPGANHTRFEHSLGVYHLAGSMADAIGLSEKDSMTVRAAGMLHDICHAPYSHTLEEIIEERTGLDHMGLARKLIKGKIRTYRQQDEDLFGSTGPISELLEKEGIDSDLVCDLIAYPVSKNKGLEDFGKNAHHSYFPSKDYAHQIIHGPVDADQMDYLVRDAHYTGVSLGMIDIERLLSTMRVFNDRIVIERGGSAAAEGLMVSRSLMYTSVYYHKTVRIAKTMITKAVEASALDVSDAYTWSDSDLIEALTEEGGIPSRLARSVQNRMLYKNVLTKFSEDTNDETAKLLAQYSKYRERKQLEQEVADKAGVDISEVAIDMPSSSTLLSKINIGKTNVSILDDGKVRSLTRTSPIAKALQARDTFGWSIIVSAPRSSSEAVRRAVKKVLNL
ncbi:MAG: HD domain-containing protein [Candidatus Methanomethylophilaceae archaeon]|nr:HD domain-containing protein [Candidatus Methanomethylophilaceae archaeon]